MIDCPKCGSTKLSVGATTAERICEDGHRFTPPETGGVVPTEQYSDSTLEHMQKTTSQYDRTCRVLAADLLRQRKEIERLRGLLHRDQTGLASALVDIKQLTRAYYWIVEGRGSYRWDDDEYQQETARALDAIGNRATVALRESGNRADAAFHPEHTKAKQQPIAEIVLELDRLCCLATPAPWRAERHEGANCVWFDRLPEGSIPIESTGTSFALGVAVGASPNEADARFIAAARTMVPAVTTRVWQLEEERQRYRALALSLVRTFEKMFERLPSDVERARVREIAEGICDG